jgi:NADH:ubiquinone oxidoreductase subunit 3 (subunit A)
MSSCPIFGYLVISLLLSLILIGVSFLFASSSILAYPEKLLAYECGFDPVDNARSHVWFMDHFPHSYIHMWVIRTMLFVYVSIGTCIYV